MDVNVRFRHALDFEFTAELAIFDLTDVTLCHAWVGRRGAKGGTQGGAGGRGGGVDGQRVQGTGYRV
jgi:hypothetical protein